MLLGLIINHAVGPALRDNDAFIRSKHTIVDLNSYSGRSFIFEPEILPKMASEGPFLVHFFYLSKETFFRCVEVTKRERKGNTVSALCT